MENSGQNGWRSDLAELLSKHGYLGLFQQADDAALTAVCSESGSPAALIALAAASNAPALARFLAAEVLFHRGEVLWLEEHKPEIAKVYARALAENFTEVADAWGLPGISDGLAGEHLTDIGEPVVPALLGLLDDEKRVFYQGSQEATLAHHYGYRVKDLAAYHICRIRNIAFEFEADASSRDAAIEALKNTVR